MDNVAPRLPSILGAGAGLVVATVSMLVQVPPHVCAMRAVAAWMVFTAFGIVIRYLLADNPDSSARSAHVESEPQILPGTTVEDLLAVEEEKQG